MPAVQAPFESATVRRRRKDARPAEIVAVATALFVERGFAATRMEEVAEIAGVAKGTVFRYFASKDELFRAVAATVFSHDLNALEDAAERSDTALAILIPELLSSFARGVAGSNAADLVGLVLAEARTFPDLARAWHDEVAGKVLKALTALIERGQARGEVRPGDPRVLAFSLISPLIMAVLFGTVFGPIGATRFDLRLLAREHAATMLAGLLIQPQHSSERS